MNADDQLARDIEADLQRSTVGRVVYLEGVTDVDVFFALLGRETESDALVDGVYVKGLGGRARVERRVALAEKRRYPVMGFTDGDGRAHADLAARFDAPYPGPLFCWKAYCIENLLARAGWPDVWGPPPDWSQALADYSAYVGINRVVGHIQTHLAHTGLHRHDSPVLGKPLRTPEETRQFIIDRQGELSALDPAGRFDEEVDAFRALIEVDIDQAHALINGKWLVRHFAPARTGKTPDACRAAWIAHVAASGGLPEVVALWQRIRHRSRT